MRALHAHATDEPIERWWGRDDWPELKSLGSYGLVQLLTSRFTDELGYRYATPWPIYERRGGAGRIMYHMIHATDHDDAPGLMQRAYGRVVRVPSPDSQLDLSLG